MDPVAVTMDEAGAENRDWTAALVIVGSEVLSGRTRDVNLSMIAPWLNEQGIRLAAACVVPDAEEDIVQAVRAASACYDHVITTGGLGPTHDDITMHAISVALNRPIARNAEAESIIREIYGARLQEVHLRTADLPLGAELLLDRERGAGCIRIGNVVALAGVPKLVEACLPLLAGKLAGGRPVLSRTIGLAIEEAEIALLLAAAQAADPCCEVASYPLWRGGAVGTNIVLRSIDQAAIDAMAKRLSAAAAAEGVMTVEGGLPR